MSTTRPLLPSVRSATDPSGSTMTDTDTESATVTSKV